MKAGSLLDDELGALRESVSSPSSGEVCLDVCLSTVFLSAFIHFLSRIDLNMHVCAEQQRLLAVNQADLKVLRRCESYHMHQKICREALHKKSHI